jgi:diguanylate cyclase (GGDEF)-like protein
MATEAHPRVTWREIFGVREFRGLFFAQLASLVGDQLAKVALSILVYDQTRSPLLAALTYGVTFLPALISGPLLGVFADTRPRRALMIVCDLARAAIVALMLFQGLSVGVLLALLFAVSALDSPFNAARAALLPDVLAGERYAVGQALTGVTLQVSQVVGFGVGGVLVAALTPRGALAVDVGTFLVSAGLLRLTVADRPAPTAPDAASRWVLITAGAREVLAAPLLRNLIGITAASFAMIIATEGLAVSYVKHQLGRGDTSVGLLTAAVPLGAALGLVALARVPAERRMPLLRLLAVLWPLPLIATVLRPPLAVTIVLWAVTGALSSFQLIGNVLFAQALTGANRGRAFAFAQSLLIAVQGLGVIVAGALAELTSPADAVALMAAVGLLACSGLVLALGRLSRSSTGLSSPVDNSRYEDVARGPTVEHAQVRPAPDQSAPFVDAAAAAIGAQAETVTLHAGRAYVASAAVLAGCVAAVVLGPWPAVPLAPAHFPWWVLAPIFAATAFFKAHFERGRNSFDIAATQIALLLGLYFATPTDLLVAAVVGTFVAEAIRKLDLLRLSANRAAHALEVVVALSIFHAFPIHGPGVSTADLAVGMLSITGADLATFLLICGIRRLHDPSISLRIFVRPAIFAMAVAVVTGCMGLLAVTAIYANASSAVLLLVLVVLVAVGFRSYASLQQQHQSLGRLYAFKEQLGVLVPRGPSLFPVLEHARDLLQATSVTLHLPGEADDAAPVVHQLTVHADEPSSETIIAGASDLSALKPPAAVCVDLQVDGRHLGVLAAEGRMGRIRGFDRSDLQLLGTVGTHVSDALERGTLLEQLQLAATHDALTGLLTLGELMRQLDEGLVRGQRFFLALLDVSGLRDVNDSLGHEAGDALLQTLGARLRESLPEPAVLARSGGGEFAVAIPDVGRQDSGFLLEAIAELGNGLVQVLGVTVELRTRVGWLFVPEDAIEAAIAVRRADLALAVAKRSLKPVARYLPEMDVDGWRRLRLVNDLREAIRDRVLTVAYQPFVTPKDGEIVGAEALVRWTHPELGVLSPDEFIVIAEHSGLIGDLTTFVLDEALAQTRRWHESGRDLRIAVNLSARCLTDMSLPGTILDLLAHHRVEPDYLTLEVTETSVAEEPVRAIAVLERLRGIGARLSIDDFGTGYSSLASLKRFPVQEVKLDRAFLSEMDAEGPDEGRNDMALISAIVALGHSLDLEIVAEGVESPVAYERLRALGVDILQGYYMGRPGPGDSLRQDPVVTGRSPEALSAPGSA